MLRVTGRLVAVGILLAVFSSVAGTDDIRLSHELRAELATLPMLAGPGTSEKAMTGTVVLVSFFASWCPPCRVEFEHLNELASEYETTELQIVAVNVYEDFLEDEQDEIRLKRFLSDTNPDFSVVEGTESVRKAFGDVDRIPTVFVFDTAGDTVMHFVHQRGAKKMSADLDELRQAVERALEGSS